MMRKNSNDSYSSSVATCQPLYGFCANSLICNYKYMVSIIYVPHFRDKEVKAQKDDSFNRRRQDSTLVSLTSQSMF